MAYFTPREIEAFFRHDDPTVDMEEYLGVLNVAHDLPPLEALAAIEELLEHAKPNTTSHGLPQRPLRPLLTCATKLLDRPLDEALRRNAKLRDAFQGVVTSDMPDELRLRRPRDAAPPTIDLDERAAAFWGLLATIEVVSIYTQQGLAWAVAIPVAGDHVRPHHPLVDDPVREAGREGRVGAGGERLSRAPVA